MPWGRGDEKRMHFIYTKAKLSNNGLVQWSEASGYIYLQVGINRGLKIADM